MSNTPSAKRNPLMQRATPLQFDGLDKEDLIALTDEQKADRFLSRWMDLMHPFSTFKAAFKGGEKDHKRILREIKNFYTRYVLNEGWEERKYVMVINGLLDARMPVSPASIERFGKKYDDESLPAQIRAKREARRKR